MPAPSRERISHIVQKWAATKPTIKRAWLFGSRIKGVNKHGGPVRDESDWDVAVELDGVNPEARDSQWLRVVNQWDGEMDDQAGWRVEVEHYNPPERVRVASAVDEYGVLVYQRANSK